MKTLIHTQRLPLFALVAAAVALLVGLLDGGSAFAAYPGGNGKIAYESAVEGNFEIFVMNADGSGQTNVSNDATAGGNNRDPAWSPDGTKIAFSRASEGHMNVFVMNADGSGQINLTPGANDGEGHTGIQPSWSPDGSKIAYTDNASIWIMDASSGAGKVKVTPAPGEAESQPAWSPDGTKIAFVKDTDIWVMNADGSGQLPLAATSRGEFRPDWSPDGTKIAYDRDGDIWIMNADGSGQTLLTGGVGKTGSEPAWSPDGTKIVFDSNGNGAPNGHDIFLMDADGSSITRLDTPVPAGDLDPSWQPTEAVAPVLSLPAELTVEATGPTGATVTFSVSATDDADPAPTVSCAPASGSTFPLGGTTVTCTATDASGNQSTGSFAVRVVDTLAPMLSLPADLTIEATAPGGAAVTYSVSATDLVDAAPTVTCAPASGSVFPVGETTVTCTATDDAGNTATGSFVVRVVVPGDTTLPVLSLPAGLTVEATGPGGAPVTYSVSATDDVDPAPSVTCTPASGSTLALGTTNVTCTAVDAAGNAASGTFIVDVVDSTAPVLGLEKFTERMFQTWEFIGAWFNPSLYPDADYPADAHDVVDPSPVVACTPPPGARLPVGSTMVRCTATDFSGNTTVAEVEFVVFGPIEALHALNATLREVGVIWGQLTTKLLTPLERARIAFEKGAMANAEKALEQFELELEKQSKKGLSSEAVAKLRTGLEAIQLGTFPSILSAIAEKLRRIVVVVRALEASAFATLRAKLESAAARLALGDRTGALKDLRDAKAALADERDKLTPKDAADLERDLDTAIASLMGPKG
jgi:Tol biopolymer transport system component